MIKTLTRFFSEKNPKIFLEIAIGGEIQGKLHFELLSDQAPKTCENFLKICTATSGVKTPKGKELSYVGSKFHRIVPGFLCQGGDITNLNGKGGWSIHGPQFADENFTIKHSSPGVLSMANQGPNTNNSQFFITFSPCPGLDGKHTAFGRLAEGEDLLKKIEAQGTANGKPRQKVVISNCGLHNEN